MKTRNEQPSFKQKAENKTDSRLDNCSLDNCSKDSRSAKGDMKPIFAWTIVPKKIKLHDE